MLVFVGDICKRCIEILYDTFYINFLSMSSINTFHFLFCCETHILSCQAVKSVFICLCGSSEDCIPFETISLLCKTCCFIQVQLIKLSNSGIWRHLN
jgi:hypothetical protein